MKLHELKSILATTEQVEFELPSGQMVESHFHVTEVGQIAKHFVDCGGTLRTEKVVNATKSINPSPNPALNHDTNC